VNKLVIVESPAKAKTIKKILGPGYIVKASMGHVQDLPGKKISIDLETFEGAYEIIPGKTKIIEELKEAADKSDEVFLCSDSDREGEAISRSLMELLGLSPSKAHRVCFNEITKKGILEGMKNPRDINMDVVNAQQARRFLDRIVGYKISPFLWNKVLMGLSAGRVQSVGLKFLAERECEIKAFVADEYWTVSATMNEGFEASVSSISGKKVVSSAKDVESAKKSENWSWLKDGISAQTISDKLKNKELVVSLYDQKPGQEYALPPFITSTLQQAGATRLGFDPDKTMRIAQKLYEGVTVRNDTKGLITYMRTDSFRVSKEAQDGALALIRARYGDNYVPDAPNYYKSKKGSQDAHECIRPTYPEIGPEMVKLSVTPEQYKLYQLIWNRFIASQMTPERHETTTCELTIDDVVLRVSGKVTTFDGWTKVYGGDREDKSLPVLKLGQKVTVNDSSANQHFTQPAARYNPASLVKKLEAEGVGRPSTYATILSTLISRNYVEKIGQVGNAPLKATDVGIAVSEYLSGKFKIMDIGFTRDMEEKLDLVEEGKVDFKELLRTFWKDLQKELKDAAKAPSVKDGVPTDEKCQKCQGNMVKRLSKWGYFLKCDQCGETKDGKNKEQEKLQEIDIACEICGSKLVLTNGRFGPFLACPGYLRKCSDKKTRSCTFTLTIDKKGKPKRAFVPEPTDVVCDKCGKKMVVRVASRRKMPHPFLSCSGYPKCRNAKDLTSEMKELGERAMTKFRENRAKDEADYEKFTLPPKNT
jgi:DNA topoisomerase-1